MLDFIRKFFSMLLIITVMNFGSLTGADKDGDITVIRDNIASGLINGTLDTFSSCALTVDEILSLTAYDGRGGLYFTDIDYNNGDRAVWPAASHLSRAEKLALEYRRVKSPVKKNEYRVAVIGLLDNWINNDYRNSNWWFGRLSNPNVIGETAILMGKHISGSRLKAVCELVGRGSFTLDRNNRNLTGANATDVAMSTIKYGVLAGSRTAVKSAVNKVAETLEYSDGEGLKTDASYFQHGNRLYMGGYGVAFISGMANIAGMLSGSKYGFNEEQLGRVASFVLDGLRIMSYGATLDPTTMGRSVSRVNSQPLRASANVIRRLASVGEMPRKEELIAYAESIENDTKNDFGLKYFPVAKFIVINTPGFYFSFRGGNDDMNYSEIINDENVLGYNSSYPGVTTIMSKGGEYTNISPVFDYSAVPGTTAVKMTDEELIAVDDFTYRALPGDYYDAYSGFVAVSSAKTVHEGIKMTVSCFACGNAALLLGADMTDAAGRKMTTTLDQSFYAGDFTCDGKTVIHNGIKYTLLSGGRLDAKAELREGNWHRNNLPITDRPAEGEIFTVFTENSDEYAYTVMAESTRAEFTVIENTPDIQAALMPDGSVAATFYKAGSFSFRGEIFSAEKPGSYIIK